MPVTSTGRCNFVACMVANSLPSNTYCVAMCSYLRKLVGILTRSLARQQAPSRTYTRYSHAAFSASHNLVTEMEVRNEQTRSFVAPVFNPYLVARVPWPPDATVMMRWRLSASMSACLTSSSTLVVAATMSFASAAAHSTPNFVPTSSTDLHINLRN